MKFLNDIKNSFYNPSFFNGLKDRTVGSSVGYFYRLTLSLSFVGAFIFGTMFSPLYSTESLKKIVSYYPAELVLAIKGGVISTNVAEPYIIKATGPLANQDKFTNLAIIDTKNPFTRDLFKHYDTNVWIGKDFVVTAKNQSQFELTDMSRTPDLTFSQEKLFGWAETIGSHHLAISLILFFFLLLAFILFFSTHLILFFITALFVLLIAKLKKIELPYKKCYQTVIHAATFPLVLETALILSGVGAPFPFFYSLILLVIVYVNLKKVDVPMVISGSINKV